MVGMAGTSDDISSGFGCLSPRVSDFAEDDTESIHWIGRDAKDLPDGHTEGPPSRYSP